MWIPPSPSHSVPNPQLFPREGDEIQSLQVAKGRGTVAAETGLSRWLLVLGSQTLGLPQHMEDTNTGTCHALE